MEEAAGSPFPLCCRGTGTDPGRALAQLPGLRGVAGEGTAGLQLILGGGQSLRGSSRLGGRCRTRPAVPTSIQSERWVTVALKMLPWAGNQCGALRKSHAPVGPGKHSRAKPRIPGSHYPGDNAGEPRAAPCLSFAVTVSPALPRRRQEGWPGSGILACERQALLFPHNCLLLAPRKIRSSCSQ